MEVKFLDLAGQHAGMKFEILELWEEILDTSEFIGGKHVRAFEAEYADACEVKHCVAVNSGTDALRFILVALGLKPGDEVITVPNTFIATTESISQAGGKIKFVDINPDTCNMDVSRIEQAITEKTKCIVPVHLYGHPADMEPILEIAEKHDLWVVEDACQAHLAEYKGRKTGSIGLAGAFSFYPGKNLGACGEGGAITTNDERLAQKVKMLRDHGQRKKNAHELEGYNGRCDALQAAVLRVKLKKLPEWNKKRRARARLYSELLGDLDSIVLPKSEALCVPVYHHFVVKVKNRCEIKRQMELDGIQTGLHYPVPLHLQKAYRYMGLTRGAFPASEEHANNILSLPIYPELTKRHIMKVADSLKKAMMGKKKSITMKINSTNICHENTPH